MYLIEIARHGKAVRNMGLQMSAQSYVLDNIFLDDDIIMPYRCDPAVQIGKFQNTVEEINLDYIEKQHLPVVRRDTGGGAIYMDMGAANFIFILSDPGTISENFKRIYDPAISGLEALGAQNVAQRGRNDLEIDGEKISGSAQTVIKGRLYAGYSLLIDIDFDAMEQALRPNQKKIASKGIKSVRKRVGGIRRYLADDYQKISVDTFEEIMLKHFLNVEDLAAAKRYVLTDEDWCAIDRLYEEKYGNWDWNFGASPRYSFSNDGRFEAGTIEIRIEIDQGKIEHLRIFGDFFGEGEISDVEETLLGCPVNRQQLIERLETIDLDHYIKGSKPEELASLLLAY